MSTDSTQEHLTRRPPTDRSAGSRGPADSAAPAEPGGPGVPEESGGEGYWYDDDASVVGLLRALRRFRRADQEMRRRMSVGMDMNETDLRALQLVIEAETRDDHLTPRDLAEHLAISSASTTKLLDRLTASGHLTRAPHPSDRRSLILASTPYAHAEIRDRLTRMHERMAAIARAVPVESRGAVVAFLDALVAELDLEGLPRPLAPDPRRTPASKVPSTAPSS